MKVNLVVSSGVHQGRQIAVTGPRFLIGRDPECHLRPASQAVSKRHCEVLVRDGKVFLKDYGSTNGTLHNDQVVQNTELELANNDRLRVGPLDFIVRIDAAAPADPPTPMPADAQAALAAVKAVSAAAPAAAKAPSGGSKPPAAPKPAASETAATAALTNETPGGDEQDRIAAMLLGMGDEEGEVPGGSTVMDMPQPGGVDPNAPAAGKPGEEPKKGGKAASGPSQDSVNAANELLMKMRKRTK